MPNSQLQFQSGSKTADLAHMSVIAHMPTQPLPHLGKAGVVHRYYI